MPQIRRILIPVDFSDVSQKALNYGIALGTAFQADLLLASVIEDRPSIVPEPHGSTPERLRAFTEAQARLNALIPEETRNALTCDCLVRIGDIEDRLLEAVTDNQVDLIIMGTHGRRAFKRWLLGCVTARILRKVRIPVITVSHLETEIEFGPLSKGRLLYATDLSYGSRRGINLAYEFARAFDAELTVLHVMPPWTGIMSGQSEDYYARLQESMLKGLKRSIPAEIRLDEKVSWELEEGIPYSVILEQGEEKDVGLIIVNLHGEHGVEPAVLGSTADRVIRGSHRPVLALPISRSEAAHQ